MPSQVNSRDSLGRLDWSFRSLAPRYRAAALAAFGLSYAALDIIGNELRVQDGTLVIIWPAAGLLLAALFLAPPRIWIWLLSLQLGIGVLVTYGLTQQFRPGWAAMYAAANSVDAIVGATIAIRLIRQPAQPRIRQVIEFFAAAAVGAAASALIGAFCAVHLLTDANYWHQWQLWWAGNWLGSLAIAPLALTWAIRWKLPDLAVRKSRPWELAFIAAVLIAMTQWIFSAPPASLTTFLQLPSMLLALLVVAAFRLPPRWSTTLAAAVVLLAAMLSSLALGPFAAEPNLFARIGSLQIFLATLLVFTFMLSTVLLEKRRTLEQLTTSEERLRREQERLQAYAHKLIGSEERVRRTIAVNMQEGVEQQLAELNTTVDAIASRSPTGLRQLLDSLRATLGQVQEHARRLIEDVSPPGLYDIGLGAALQWLAIYMRGRDALHVALTIRLNEQMLALETRVLIFQVIRELLRNVAAHARVDSAEVNVTQHVNELTIEVIDHGRGFDWQYDLFTDPPRGFGLFSVSDRVRTANGRLTVDTAPGKGCRVTVYFPLAASMEPLLSRRSIERSA
jgi:signal transduction histidine kinase